MWNPVFIRARDLDDAWHQLLWNVNEYGRRYKISSGSFEGAERLSFDFVSGFISNPHVEPLTPRMPEGSNLPSPCTDDDAFNYFANYLMDAKLAPNEHYKYASFIKGGNELCETRQIDWIINHLKEQPQNEHCYCTIGNPEDLLNYDKPYKYCSKCEKWFGTNYKKCAYCGGELKSFEEKRGTTCCLRGLDFKIIDGYLFTHVVYRSWALFSGWGLNMAGFTLLNQYMAQEIGVNPGPLAFSSKGLHCYDFELDVLSLRLGR